MSGQGRPRQGLLGVRRGQQGRSSTGESPGPCRVGASAQEWPLPELSEDHATHWGGGWRACGAKGPIVAVISVCLSAKGLGLLQL